MTIEDLVREALERLRQRARALGGPLDITDVFSELDDYPTLAADCQASFDRGFIEGVAAALDLTVLELLDQLGLPIPVTG